MYICRIFGLMRKNVKPYQDSSDKKTQVGQMFNNIAKNYDLLNRVLSLGIDQIWRRKMVNSLSYLKDRTSSAILDVATGTGDVALAIAKQYPQSNVIGVDIAGKMLEKGDQKIKHQKLDNRIRLELGDAESLAFDNNSFDGITVAFGVRNFENLMLGLQEMYRVLRDNSQLIILEFSKPRGFVFKGIYHIYFKYLLPLVGKIKSGDAHAYDYLFRSVQNFPDGSQFTDRLKEIGFSDVQEKRLTFGICTLYKAKK